MKNFCLWVVCAALAWLAAESATIGDKCYHIFNNNIFYSLDKLQQPLDYNYTLPDNSTLYFNFCYYAKTKCNNDTKSYGVVQSSDRQACFRVTNDQLFSGYSFEMMDSNDPTKGITILIADGDEMEPGLSYEMEIDIFCNHSVPQLQVTSVTQTRNRFIIESSSQYGCPTLQLSKIWEFLSSQKVLFTLILVSVGALECFFGLRMLKPTL